MKKKAIGRILASSFIMVTIVYAFVAIMHKKPDKLPAVNEKATIGVSLEPITALVMIADEKGYFMEHGLHMTVKYFEGGNVAIRDMFAGKIDFATVADNMVVYNSFKRQDFNVLATIGTSGNEPRIVARKDRGIARPADLKGKRIGTVKGTGVHYFLYLFLLKHGLSGQDIQLFLKDPANTFTTFMEGGLDAISTREPYVTQAVKALADNALVFAQPRLMIKNYDIVATKGYIAKHPEVVKKMLKALIQAEEFAAANQQEAVHIVAKRHGFDDAAIAQQLPEMQWKVFLEQSMLIRFEDQAGWMIKNNIVDNTVMPDYFKLTHIESLLLLKPEAVTIIR